jgi:tripartite-type tricarboxylate transporter receptor subunit TctC
VSSVQRSAALPDVPTSLEAGYAGSDFNLWIGVFAPAGTPPAIAERLNREIGVALANPAVRDKLANQAIDTMTMGTGEFAAFVTSEVASMAKLAKALNLTPN